MRKKFLGSVSAAVFLANPAFVMAQESGPAAASGEQPSGTFVFEEIIVSATRRDERLQDVPISVTVFSQEELSVKGIVGYEGLAQETPGIYLNRASANNNTLTGRGLATNQQAANLQATVAIYVDDLPISANGNSTILDTTLFDVKGVELLRGPQGTLFGATSLAGAVRILSNDPDLSEFDYSALVDYGLTGDDSIRQRYNGMVNIPLVKDELALRIVGFYRHEDGYLENVGTGIDDANTLETWGGRATLLWAPTERFSAQLRFSREDSTPKDSGLTGGPGLDSRQRISDEPDLFTGDLNIYNATLKYQFDGAELTSSSTYSEFDQKFFVDLANTFGFLIPFRIDATAHDKTFVQETRLVSNTGGSFDWVIGGYYFFKRRDVDSALRGSNEFLAMRGLTGLDGDTFQLSLTHTNASELAVFGELTYRLSDKFWLTGGLRYGGTSARGIAEEGGFSSNFLGAALTPGLSGPLFIFPIASGTGLKAEKTKPVYKLSASYKPVESLTTYATVSTAFRAPVANARAGFAPPAFAPNDLTIPDGAEADKITNYEIGAKGSFFGGRLLANISAYWIEWRNIQVQANRTSDQVQFATNINGARSRGIELELTARPVDGLTLSFSGDVNNSGVTKLTPELAAVSGAVLDQRLAAPGFKSTTSARYDFSVAQEFPAFATASWTHVESFPALLPNVPGNPNAQNAGFGFTDTWDNFNLTAGITIEDISVTAYVENLTNNDEVIYVHPDSFIASRFGTLRPRTVGLRIGFNM